MRASDVPLLVVRNLLALQCATSFAVKLSRSRNDCVHDCIVGAGRGVDQGIA